MSSSTFRRTTLVLLFFALLTASWASAAGLKAQAKSAAPAPGDLLSRAWSLLVSLWGEEGCHLDPSGRCVTSPVQVAPPKVDTDTGCNIDPSGRCTP